MSDSPPIERPRNRRWLCPTCNRITWNNDPATKGRECRSCANPLDDGIDSVSFPLSEGTGIGARILATRRERGMSQRRLAEQSGVSRSYLCDIERGRGQEPSRRIIHALAEAMDVPPSTLEPPALDTMTRDERSVEIRTVSGDLYRWLSEGHRLIRKLEALGLT